jgi:hypothetical protein
MPTVESNEAKQHQDHLHEVVQHLVELWKQSLTEDQRREQDDPDIEIKIGRDVVFRRQAGKTVVNKLTPTRIAQIEKALAQATAEQSQTGAIKISINQDTVFHRDKDGKIQTNRLSPTASQGQPQPTTPAQKIPKSAQSKPVSPKPQPQPMPAPENPQAVMEALEHQVIPKLPEGNTKSWLKNATAAIAQATHATQDWTKDRIQDLSNAPITKTASHLLEQYGSRKTDGSFTYNAEEYVISATGRNNITIADRSGNTLMKYKETVLGAQIVEHQMDRFHKLNFLKAHNHHSKKLQTPVERAQMLGALAPRGDREAATTEKYVQVYRQAHHILHFEGKPNEKGRTAARIRNLTFEQDPKSKVISVTDHNRGVVLLDHHGLSVHCTSDDRKQIAQISRAVAIVHESTPAQTTLQEIEAHPEPEAPVLDEDEELVQ